MESLPWRTRTVVAVVTDSSASEATQWPLSRIDLSKFEAVRVVHLLQRALLTVDEAEVFHHAATAVLRTATGARSASIAASTPPRACGTPASASASSIAAKRAQQHRLVQVAHVADAEDAPLQRARGRGRAPRRSAPRRSCARDRRRGPAGTSTAVSESEANVRDRASRSRCRRPAPSGARRRAWRSRGGDGGRRCSRGPPPRSCRATASRPKKCEMGGVPQNCTWRPFSIIGRQSQ